MNLTVTARTGIVLTLAVLGLASTGVASAYLAGWGGGAGSAGTGTTQSVTLSPATPATHLFPGGVSGVALSAANSNPGPVRIGSLTLDPSQGSGGFAVDGAHSACDLATLSFATQSNGGAGWTVPGGGSLSITLPGALSMSVSAVNACQGASFTVYLTAGS